MQFIKNSIIFHTSACMAEKRVGEKKKKEKLT